MGERKHAGEFPIDNSDLIDFARQQVRDVESSDDAGPLFDPTADREPFHGPPPDSFSAYTIEREMRRGGQGVVYQATQEATKRKVAIKVMKEGPFAGVADKARFDREVEVLGQLNHPNIVTIHDTGIAAGCHYFVMDYVSGQPLDVYMASGEHSVEDTLRLFGKICEAVNAAHLRGIIHRDLKPGNIRIDADGEPHILDFGLAKVAASEAEASAMTMTGQFVGSLPWASPEQAEGVPAKIDVRTDVYSLGVILYQMLTARFPYEVSGNMRDVLDNVMNAEPARPSAIRKQINDEVETIVLKCLHKDRDRRYQSAGELGRDIQHYLRGEPIEAKRDSTAYLLRKHLRRYRLPVAVAAAFVLMTTIALATSLTFWQQATRQRDRAEEEAERARIAAAKSEEVARFTREMLSGVDPAVAGTMDKTLVRLILDNASERIEKELGTQPEVAASLHATIGNTYVAIAEYELAEPHLETALGLRRELLGEKHQETLTSISELAALYEYQGRYDDAEPLFRQVFADRLQLLGEEDPDTLTSMCDLGWFLSNARRRFDEAEPLLRQTLETGRRVLGDEHTVTLLSMNNLGLMLNSLGEHAEAERLLRETLEIYKRVVGEHHHHTLYIMNNLALTLQAQGKYDEAEALYTEALQARQRLLGPRHFLTIGSMFNLGCLYSELNRLEEAETLLQQVLEGYREVSGEQHPYTLLCMNNLALVLTKLHDYEQAETLFRAAVEGRRVVLTDAHPYTFGSMRNLGWLYSEWGRHEQAESWFAQAVEKAEAALPPEASETAVYRRDWGACLTKLGRYEEAEAQLQAGYEVLRTSLGAEDPRAQRTIERLVDLYEAWHDAESDAGHDVKAAEWRAKLPSAASPPD